MELRSGAFLQTPAQWRQTTVHLRGMQALQTSLQPRASILVQFQ